jgi:cytochrome c oxidase cbb3-type subunit I
MSVLSPPSQPSPAGAGGPECAPGTPDAIDTSCRPPLALLFLAAAVWLLVGSVFGLLASIKFHAPGFLADPAWLTYGRVRPAATNALLYGFCVPAGLGVGLWMIARLGRTCLAGSWLVSVGGLVWNLGVALGIWAILQGGSTGFEHLEMPGHAAALTFLGYLMMAFWGVVTLHRRQERPLYVSQWFLLAALFWFPWVYSTANLVLLGFGTRGIAQAVIAWWYGVNLLAVWFGLVGLAAVFYFVPKLTGRELHSRYLALLTFWMLLLFGSCGGIPASAPVPAWMPAWSTLAAGMGLITIIAVALNVRRTLEGKCSRLMGHPALRFIGLGLIAFVLAGLANLVSALPGVSRVTQFTWFIVARDWLNAYGYFAMVLFGSVYYILPQLTRREFPFVSLVRLHFWLAALGVLFIVVPLAVGGILQGLRLQQPQIGFTDIARGTLPFLRVSTVGDLLLALGHLMFVANLGGLMFQWYRARAMSAWAEATAEIKPAEVGP